MLGYLALVLHAHLPFVNPKTQETILEEKWLYEAMTECYIPLLQSFECIRAEGIPFRLTLSLSPTLISMLADPWLQNRYRTYLSNSLTLAEKELERTYSQPLFHPTARMYYERLLKVSAYIERQKGRLLPVFKSLFQQGHLELITSAATHGYLPFTSNYRALLDAQIAQSVQLFRKHFKETPRGLWLPECAYQTGIDYTLKKWGLEYFFLESHGILFANPRPRYGYFAPIKCPSGLAAFGRDPETAWQVWSRGKGYPGDYDYRDYYRDIGFDLELPYLQDHLYPRGIRSSTGFKYYRITGKANQKEPYQPSSAKAKAETHAAHFLAHQQKRLGNIVLNLDRPPLIVSPYDAELFGHWWFEGPQWLEELLRLISKETSITLISPGDYLERYPHLQPAQPASSSWGAGGYHSFWLNQTTDWIYPQLHQSIKALEQLIAQLPRARGWRKRALNQGMREILLAQSSDWAFMLCSNNMVDYAQRRTMIHLDNVNRLCQGIRQQDLDLAWLKELERENNIFPKADYLQLLP